MSNLPPLTKVPDKVKCTHCKKQCEPVELDEEDFNNIDICGPQCLPEVKQDIWDGLTICESCYHKEMGL